MSLAAEAGLLISAMFIFMIQKQIPGLADPPLSREEQPVQLSIAEAFIYSAVSLRRSGKIWIASCGWIWNGMLGNPSLPCPPPGNLLAPFSLWKLCISLAGVKCQQTAIRRLGPRLCKGSRNQVADKPPSK